MNPDTLIGKARLFESISPVERDRITHILFRELGMEDQYNANHKRGEPPQAFIEYLIIRHKELVEKNHNIDPDSYFK